jgi:SAM-dependent methyltransferase
MGKSSREMDAEWRRLTASALLSCAGKIAAGTDDWGTRQLRAAFFRRVAIGQDPLGDQYSAAYTAEERRSIGATLTPAAIVDAMIEWAKREAASVGIPERIIDCGAGTGRFALAAARAFPNSQVIAIENDPTMALLLRANVTAAALNRRIESVEADFRSLVLESISGPTLFLGNPPYVRHHRIGGEWKRWYADTLAKHGIKASQLAGLHLHFFAKVLELARDGDFGCFITAAEWLDVGYGSALKSLLADGLGGTEIHILEPAAEAFPGTMTTAAITAFRIGRRPPKLRIRRVERPSELAPLTGGRKVGWDEVSRAPKWSMLVYPNARAPRGTIELGELCRVHRGQVTGNNRIWIAGPHAHGLSQSLLKPTVTRAEELIQTEPVLRDDRHLARVIDLPIALDELDGENRAAVERFLGWAKRAGAADGYIAQHRNPWWAVRLRDPAPIVCTYMARRRPAFVRNRARAHLLNIAHGIYPREELSEDRLMKLVTALRQGVTREQGRTYSGGLTKFEPREIERIPIAWMDDA